MKITKQYSRLNLETDVTQCTLRADPPLDQPWSTINDADPGLNQQLPNGSCLLVKAIVTVDSGRQLIMHHSN